MTRSSILRSVLFTGACFATLNLAQAQETEPVEVEEEARQETIIVRGEFIPNEVRNTSEVANLIDAGDFTLQGDSDAAAALSRVAGIATSEDNFIYVRGLNERYSTALLNGSPLPSPAPLRRVAPLDLFPTSALKSILVQKTYSPDLPGEFGGGMVDIRTKAIPDSRFLEVSIGGGINTVTSFQDGLLYDGGDTDFLGFDDGTRDRPSLAEGLTPTFGQELTDDSSLLVMQEGEVGPNFDFGITGGERFDVNADLSVGMIGSLGYSNSWVTREGRRGFAINTGTGLGQFFDFDRRSTENTIGLNALAAIGFDIYDDHEIQFTGLITRSTEKEARITEGVNEEDTPIRTDNLEWFERQLWTTQVTGQHYFPNLQNLEVEWRGSYSEALRDAPYQLTNIYQLNESTGEYFLQGTSSGNEFQFSRVDDDTTDFGIDGTLPFENTSGECVYLCEVELKAGYSYVENDRNATSLLYGILGIDGTTNTLRNDFAYASIFNAGTGSVIEVGSNVFPQFYVATLEIDAAYVGLDAQITPYIRAAIGGRYEDAIQAVDTRDIGGDLADNVVEGVIEESDFLPAATITWNPIDDLQVRFGYSQTITRPQFRELAPAIFVNTETDVTFFGNPYLENAEIENFDARFEYYFARDQFFTIGLFYKDMVNPIEEIIVPTENVQTTFLNAPAAELYGVEVEYEQVLDFEDWFGWTFLGDNEFSVKTNYTWSDSEVSADGDVAINVGTPLSPVRGETPADGRIEDGRRLQGQSEHLFNLQLIYTDPDADLDANLLFNYASERIRTAETVARDLPAIIEEPPATVDFVLNKGLEIRGGEYELSFSAQNIFGEGYDAYQERGSDRITVDSYEQGTILSVGLKKIF
ncbi:MAG: TonB-dependent receptor [Henriciella sp.]|nr:TonB-dependent receptor [Henriciella sp.]